MAVSSASLYVGDLDARVSEHHLWEHFKPAGSLISCRVCTDSASRKSLGYGYLNFQNPADAQKALETMNGSRILDKPCRIMPVQRDPTLRKSGVGNIIIKNLPTDLDQGALFQVFQKFGKITSVKLATDETGKSRGFGYVNYETEESATSAVKEANGLTMEDKAIVVERFRSRQAIQDELMKKFTNLYIKNIDPAIDEAKLTEFFTQFGVITSAVIMKTDDGHSKGFGFVSFDDHEAAVQAVEATHGKPELAREGATLFVGRAQSKKERSLDKERKWRERQAHYAKFPNLYIKNLDDTSAEDQLAEVFGRFGPTESVRIARDPVTKVSRGFGFVSFKEHSHAQKAMTELAGSTILSSKPLYIAYAQKRDIRRQQLEEIQKKRSRMGMGQPGFGGMPGAGGPPGPLQGGMLPPNFYGGANLQAPGYGMPPFGGMSLRPPGGMLPQQPPRPPMGMVPPQQLMPPTLQRMAPQVPRPMVKPAVPAPQARAQPVIDMSYLANLSPEHQKNVLGERLYTYISKRQPEQSSKITGMLLEMDNSEILNLLDSPDLLDSKINEAVDVLRHHSGAM